MGILKLLFQGSFIVEYFFASALFMVPLEKRSQYPLRLLLGFLLQLVLGDLVLYYAEAGWFPWAVAFLVSYCLGIVLFLACTTVSFWDAVFGATCAYATQHLGYVFFSALEELVPMPLAIADGVETLIFCTVAISSYFLFGRKLANGGRYAVQRSEALRSVLLTIPFAYFLSVLAEQFRAMDVAGNQALFLISRLYAALCCIFVLWVQTSINEKAAVVSELNAQQLLWQTHKDQYQLSKENIDLINQKCHDLKHQIAALRTVSSEEQRERSLGEIERSVMIYDSTIQTGNEVLDTILTERSLSCEKEQITWTCVADGKQLEFIDPVDLYTILGNAIDNAIEAVRKLEEPDHRVVSVTIYAKQHMSVLQIENYYEGELHFAGGLPVSSKQDHRYHGFGVKSIRSTVEKYGGSISIDTENHIFLLCILLPTP